MINRILKYIKKLIEEGRIEFKTNPLTGQFEIFIDGEKIEKKNVT